MIVSELTEQKRRSLLGAFHQQNQYYVFYYTHRDNIPSIKKFGILSRNEVIQRGLDYRNYSDDAVQDTRESLGIHDYVNFYFTPYTTTTFAISRDMPEYYDELVFLRISLKDILTDDSITSFKFTNGNAGSMYTRTSTEAEDIERLPWDLIRAPSRGFTKYEGARRSSEVLVKPSVKIYPATEEFVPNAAQK